MSVMRERIQRVVDEADKALGGFGGYPPSYKWTDAFIQALADDGLRLIDQEGCACERREKLIAEAMYDGPIPRGKDSIGI